MLIAIPAVLSCDETAGIRQQLASANWVDGAGTAGHVAAQVKANRQLADGDPLGRDLGTRIVERLAATPRFIAAALPLKVIPPRFNAYSGAEPTVVISTAPWSRRPVRPNGCAATCPPLCS
jgi:PKHD-type hydroxylase